MLNEMLDFGDGITGLALNLDETEVGVIILGDYTQLQEGDEVRATGQAAAGARRQGPARPRRQHARRAARRQGADRQRRRLSRREARAGHHPPPSGQPAGADRHHGDRRDDSDRPRSARADHRRSLDRQDDDLHRHDHQPGAPQPRGRGGGRHRLPAALLHLRRDRPEAVDHRPDRHRARRSRRDALHHHRRGAGVRFRRQPVPGAVCRRGDRRMVHGQRHGRADRLRRSVQARGRLPPGLARAEAAVGPRSLSGRRVLPAQPSARTRRARRRAVRQRLAHRPADHRDAGGRRVRLHSRPTSSRSPTGRSSSRPICSIRASVRRSRSASRCRASARPRSSRR